MIPHPIKITRRRGVLALLLFASVGCGLWWQSTRLNEMERQLVGAWTRSEVETDGSTFAQDWLFHPDHTCHLHNSNHRAARPGRPARHVDQSTEGTWRVRKGQLCIDPERPALKRLNLMGMSVFHNIRSCLTGKKTGIIDGELAQARVEAVEERSMTLTWWDPWKQADTPTQVWSRQVVTVENIP